MGPIKIWKTTGNNNLNFHNLCELSSRVCSLFLWCVKHLYRLNNAFKMFLTTTHRVTSPKWQNENFFTAFPPKDTNFDSHPRTKMPLWKSMSPMEKSQHNIGEKKVILDTLKRVRENSFTLPVLHTHTHPKAAQLTAQRDLLSLWFLPWEKVRVCEQALSFLRYARCCSP